MQESFQIGLDTIFLRKESYVLSIACDFSIIIAQHVMGLQRKNADQVFVRRQECAVRRWCQRIQVRVYHGEIAHVE